MGHHVKTAISMDESLFDALVRTARNLRVSRSQVLADALAEYLERRHNQELLARINAAYADAPDADEQAPLRHARRRHRRIAGEES